MKLKSLVAAVAVATAASQALAISIVAQPTPDLTLSFSGATAVDIQFSSYIEQKCQAGTLDTYIQPADKARAYYCTVTTSAGDVDVLFRKESGGSSRGVAPVAQGAGGTVNAIDLSTCAEDSVGSQTWTCADSLIQVQSEVGISDVEPALFTLSPNVKPGTSAPNVAAAPLTVQPVNINTFGVVVSPALRNALQAAQGLTVGSDDVSQMPSLASNLIAAIFAGDVESWNELKDAAGNGIASSLSDPTVNVCLRTPGSGTQAQFNAFYMGIGCAYNGGSNLGAASRVPLKDADGQDGNGFLTTVPNPINVNFPPVPRAKPYAYWNSGSSDMGKCLTELSNANRWAIGVQSLEKVAETKTDRNNFKYVAVDGVAPTLENVAAGLYRNVASASIQWNDSVLTDTTKLELAQDFVDLAQGVDSVATSNAELKAGTGVPQIADASTGANINSGNLVFAKGSTVVSVPFDATNPVAPFNQGLVGPSSCATVSTAGSAFDVSRRH